MEISQGLEGRQDSLPIGGIGRDTMTDKQQAANYLIGYREYAELYQYTKQACIAVIDELREIIKRHSSGRHDEIMKALDQDIMLYDIQHRDVLDWLKAVQIIEERTTDKQREILEASREGARQLKRTQRRTGRPGYALYAAGKTFYSETTIKRTISGLAERVAALHKKGTSKGAASAAGA